MSYHSLKTVAQAATSTRWRMNWKDGVSRNIRVVPLDGVQAQNWPHAIYKSKTAEQTAQTQARPVLPDDVDRKLAGEPEREVPWACANRQHQELALMTAEPCACNPEQVPRCAEQLAPIVHQEKMFEHDVQVLRLDEAASYLLDDNPNGLPWKTIVSGKVEQGRWVRQSPGHFVWAMTRRVVLERERWRERRFRGPHTELLSDQQIGAAFVAMLYVADDLDAAFSQQHERTISLYCNAPTLSARAYQAATSVLTAYYDVQCIGPAGYDRDGVWRRRDFSEWDIWTARIVAEVFDRCLPPRRIKQSPKADNPVDDYFIVTRMLDKSEDLSLSSYKIAELYDLNASTIRNRFNRKLEDIEGQLGKYCNSYNASACYHQTASRPVYNIISAEMPIAERLTKPREFQRPISEPQGPVSRARQRSELAVLKLAPQQLPPGAACHYTGTAEVRCNREYPTQPYGTEPLKIWLPQPAHGFKYEVSTVLPPALGLPFDNNFQRWAASWMTRGTEYKTVPEYFPIKLRGEWRGKEDIETSNVDSGDDLVNKLKAHSTRGDDRITRVHDAYEFDIEVEDETPLFSDDAFNANVKHEE
jgi:hypothetical protein